VEFRHFQVGDGKGPYLDLKLPFRRASEAELPFNHMTLGYRPYYHQMLAFNRLAGDSPLSTIIATGTGYGKTECFMLPVLDDCVRRRDRGIKTIIVYPMTHWHRTRRGGLQRRSPRWSRN